jgi:hypothetical protein
MDWISKSVGRGFACVGTAIVLTCAGHVKDLKPEGSAFEALLTETNGGHNFIGSQLQGNQGMWSARVEAHLFSWFSPFSVSDG